MAALHETAKNLKAGLKAELGREHYAKPHALHQVPNPFVYPGELWTEREKKVVRTWGLVIVPLRVLLMLVLLVPTYLLLRLSIVKVGQDEFDVNKPMTPWRRRMQLPIAYLMRLTIVLLGLRVETVGQPCLASEAKVVVCAPHSTLYDTLYLMYAYSIPSSISKAENLRVPVFGSMLRAIQTIAVDRADKTNRHAALDLLRARCRPDDDGGGGVRHVLIFPEGTCTNRRALITFKRGAFSSGVPVQPVALEWPDNEFDVTWTSGSGPSRLVLAVHLLCQPRINLRVHFLPVHRPTLEEQADADLFASNVRAEIAAVLGVGVTNHSTEDMFLAKQARKLQVSADSALSFEFQELSSLFHITASDAQALLARYARAYGKGGGGERITAREFASVLGIPLSSTVQELFDLVCDDDDVDGVDFKHLLVRVCQISSAFDAMAGDLDAAIELVWEALLVGGGGGGETAKESIPVDELNKRLGALFPGFAGNSGASGPRLFKKSKEGGSVDFATFKQTIKRHPEMLYVALGSLAAAATNEEEEEALPSSPSPTMAIRRRLSVLQQPQPN